MVSCLKPAIALVQGLQDILRRRPPLHHAFPDLFHHHGFDKELMIALQGTEMETAPPVFLILHGGPGFIFQQHESGFCVQPHGGAHHPERHAQIAPEFQNRQKSIFL